MTEHQKNLVRSSFIKIAPIAEETADLFYSRLFEIAPFIRPMFRGEIHEQEAKMMTMLRSLVENIDSLNERISQLEPLGRIHWSYSVSKGHYDIIASALLWTLERMLGKDFTDDVRSAWVSLYVDLSAIMKNAASKITTAA